LEISQKPTNIFTGDCAGSTIEYVFSFNKEVFGFTASDIIIKGGASLQVFQQTSLTTYEAILGRVVSPGFFQSFSVIVERGAAVDSFGVPTNEARYDWTGCN
jgi:hypothetical protein